MKNILKNLIWILLLLMVVYVFQDKIEQTVSQLRNQYLPCRSPIVYSIGAFNTEFDISEEEFIKAIKEAEAIWEEPSGKDLFVYTGEARPSNLEINLIYDSRQQVTEKQKELDVSLNKSKASYDALKAKFEDLKLEINQDQSAYNSKVLVFEARKDKYQNDVEYANTHGGADSNEYARLEREKDALNTEVNTTNKLQANLNQKVSEFNALVPELNDLAKTLNLDVQKFNEIGGQNDEEFEEGVYIRDMDGTRINIYQFDSSAKLVRLLAHELGHALGLPHVEDPQAIMYRLNSSANEKLTKDDLAELNKRCEAKFFEKF